MTTNTAGSETVSAVLRALRERLEIAEDFPDDVLDEAAASAEAGLADMALADRREYPFVTIDPPDSMDLDQAVHIEREGEGYLVRYAISAVGLFIRPGGALERETHRRTQTVYGPDGSIPLHPHALSHGAASLLPNEDRPAYLWYLHLNPTGNSATSGSSWRSSAPSPSSATSRSRTLWMDAPPSTPASRGTSPSSSGAWAHCASNARSRAEACPWRFPNRSSKKATAATDSPSGP